MNDYMKALHQRFFREPAYPEIRREAETLRLALRESWTGRTGNRC